MSGALDILAFKEEDATKMLVATTHWGKSMKILWFLNWTVSKSKTFVQIGSENVNFQMEQYVYKRRQDGVHIINLGRTWEKILLAARAIVAIEQPGEVCIVRVWEIDKVHYHDDIILSSFGAEYHWC